MNTNFSKLRLIYKITVYIAELRQEIINDLVAYHDDTERYKKNMLLLTHLSQYESQFLIKFGNLESDDPGHFNDQMQRQLEDEIHLMANPISI